MSSRKITMIILALAVMLQLMAPAESRDCSSKIKDLLDVKAHVLVTVPKHVNVHVTLNATTFDVAPEATYDLGCVVVDDNDPAGPKFVIDLLYEITVVLDGHLYKLRQIAPLGKSLIVFEDINGSPLVAISS